MDFNPSIHVRLKAFQYVFARSITGADVTHRAMIVTIPSNDSIMNFTDKRN